MNVDELVDRLALKYGFTMIAVERVKGAIREAILETRKQTLEDAAGVCEMLRCSGGEQYASTIPFNLALECAARRLRSMTEETVESSTAEGQ